MQGIVTIYRKEKNKMNLRKKVTGFALGLALMLGAGGVFAANGILKEAVGTKAAAATIATLTFPDKNQENNKNSDYAKTWTAICADSDEKDVEFSIANFNNNSWNNEWTYIKCGSKNAASVASIQNTTSFNKKVTSLSVTIDAVTTDSVNSFYVLGSEDSSFSNPTQVTRTISTGDIMFTDDAFAECNYFKIMFDCKKAKNGIVTVSKVTYYGIDTSPSLLITNEPAGNLEINSTGKLGYEPKNATATGITWSTSDNSIVDIDNDGNYTAKAGGVATITASMTCEESSTPVTATIDLAVNYGVITVDEAYTIASNLPAKATSKYFVTVEGKISSKYSKASGTSTSYTVYFKTTDGNEFQIYYGYLSNLDGFDSWIVNGTLTVKGNLYHFVNSSSASIPELTNPSFVSYTDDAIKFAQKFIADTTAPCSGTEDDKSEALAPVWVALKAEWDKLDTYAQAKLKAATSTDSDSDIAAMAARYDQIVNKYSSLDNFINRTVTPASAARYNGIIGSDSNALYFVLIVTAVVTAIGGIVLFRRRKHQ